MALSTHNGHWPATRSRSASRFSTATDGVDFIAAQLSATRRRRLATIALFTACTCWAEPSSPSFTIQRSTMSPGVATTASAHVVATASLGDPVQTGTIRSTAFELRSGFWPTVTSVRPLCELDVDGDGFANAATDGALILRAMFGLTGASVTDGAIGPGATRSTWAAIQPKLHFRALDIDGNGATRALSDGLILLRAMLGLTGTAVSNGAVAPGATRASWPAIRAYLNTRCGMSFSP